ncbi:MAG: hypothetical protein Tsb0020_48270 [Haliangiales bacterium]
MFDMHFDYLLVGGGLQNSLIALAVLEASPAARLAIVEQATALGGDHTWCFHSDDISPAATSFVEPLVAHRWPGYEVAFPRLTRSLSTPYAAVTCASLDRTVRARVDAAPNATLLLDARAESVSGDSVTLADGRRLTAELVIDARGPERCAVADAHTGYQKFVGLEVVVSAPHGRDRPFLMDATVEQVDGFRFVYTLPLGPDRLLIEDTYFSDTPTLNVGKVTAEVYAYAAARGYHIDEVIRTERGVLPLPWAGRHAHSQRQRSEEIHRRTQPGESRQSDPRARTAIRGDQERGARLHSLRTRWRVLQCGCIPVGRSPRPDRRR